MTIDRSEVGTTNTDTAGRPQRVYVDAEDQLLDNNTAVRFLGTVSLLLGCWLAHSSVYLPLSQALANHKSFYITSGAVGAVFIAIAAGTIMLIAGRHTRKFLFHRWRNATPVNIIVTVMLVAAALACDHYFEDLLTGLGYKLSRP